MKLKMFLISKEDCLGIRDKNFTPLIDSHNYCIGQKPILHVFSQDGFLPLSGKLAFVFLTRVSQLVAKIRVKGAIFSLLVFTT